MLYNYQKKKKEKDVGRLENEKRQAVNLNESRKSSSLIDTSMNEKQQLYCGLDIFWHSLS